MAEEPVASPAMDLEDPGYRAYVDYHNLLGKQITEEQSSLDKWLLTLSAGSYGLSIAAVPLLISMNYPWLLVSGWFFFAVSLGLVLASFHVSVRAAIREQELHTEAYMGSKQYPVRNSFGEAVPRLNLFALIAFYLGVVTLGVFAGVNFL